MKHTVHVPVALLLMVAGLFLNSVSAQLPAVPTAADLDATPIPERQSAAPEPAVEEADPFPVFEAEPESRPAHPITDIFIPRPAEAAPTPTPTPPPEAFLPPQLGEPEGPEDGADEEEAEEPQPAAAESAVPTLDEVMDLADEEAVTTRTLDILTTLPIVHPPAPDHLPQTVATDRLDLNSATQKELAALPGMDPYRADLIIRHRQAIQGFRRIEDLRGVFGISEALYLSLLDHLVIQSPPERVERLRPVPTPVGPQPVLQRSDMIPDPPVRPRVEALPLPTIDP